MTCTMTCINIFKQLNILGKVYIIRIHRVIMNLSNRAYTWGLSLFHVVGISNFFPVRYSYRAYIYTAAELPASPRKMNRRSLSLSLGARAVHFSTHRCLHSKHRDRLPRRCLAAAAVQAANLSHIGRVTWSRVLINRRGSGTIGYRVSRNSICLTHAGECTRVYIRVRYYARANACEFIHTRDLIYAHPSCCTC